MTTDALREDREGVAIVTLNRPDKLNAINMDMRNVIFDAVDDLRERRDLRVLLIRSTGRYFTAGVDISGELGSSALQMKNSWAHWSAKIIAADCMYSWTRWRLWKNQ